MTLTLKETNEFNKDKLTIAQVRAIHSKHGHGAYIYAGELVRFIHDGFGVAAREFMAGIERSQKLEIRGQKEPYLTSESARYAPLTSDLSEKRQAI